MVWNLISVVQNFRGQNVVCVVLSYDLCYSGVRGTPRHTERSKIKPTQFYYSFIFHFILSSQLSTHNSQTQHNNNIIIMWEWDEFEDNTTPDSDQPHHGHHSHLNFDLFSALSTPKVMLLLHSLFSNYFFFFQLVQIRACFYNFCVWGRIIIRYLKWIMMLPMTLFAPITFVQLWFVMLCCVVSIFLLLGFPIGPNLSLVVHAEVAPGQAKRGLCYYAIPRD